MAHTFIRKFTDIKISESQIKDIVMADSSDHLLNALFNHPLVHLPQSCIDYIQNNNSDSHDVLAAMAENIARAESKKLKASIFGASYESNKSNDAL